jgi:hypothetical protein
MKCDKGGSAVRLCRETVPDLGRTSPLARLIVEECSLRRLTERQASGLARLLSEPRKESE